MYFYHVYFIKYHACAQRFTQLNRAGVSISSNCSMTNFNSEQMDAIYHSLDLFDTISKAESAVVSIYPSLTYSHPIHTCAWINDRILGNCEDSQGYNSTTPVRNALNNICGGRRREPCNPQLCTVDESNPSASIM